MPLYNSSEVFVPAKQYGNTIHSDSLDIKKTERDALFRPVTRGGARGAFAPSPQAPKVRILILNIQVK